MEYTKKNNWFRNILLVLFVMFLCLYSVSLNGYEANLNRNKTLYTEEQVNKFEDDVENGEYLDFKDYVLASEVDYANDISKFGEKLSKGIEYIASKSLEVLENLFTHLFGS